MPYQFRHFLDLSGAQQIKIGTATVPASGEIDIDVGFRPTCVYVYVHDDSQSFYTYSVALECANDVSKRKGFYFQSDGYTRTYSLSTTPERYTGHVTNIISNGFSLHCLESFFGGKEAKYIAVVLP